MDLITGSYVVTAWGSELTHSIHSEHTTSHIRRKRQRASANHSPGRIVVRCELVFVQHDKDQYIFNHGRKCVKGGSKEYNITAFNGDWSKTVNVMTMEFVQKKIDQSFDKLWRNEGWLNAIVFGEDDGGDSQTANCDNQQRSKAKKKSSGKRKEDVLNTRKNFSVVDKWKRIQKLCSLCGRYQTSSINGASVRGQHKAKGPHPNKFRFLTWLKAREEGRWQQEETNRHEVAQQQISKYNQMKLPNSKERIKELTGIKPRFGCIRWHSGEIFLK